MTDYIPEGEDYTKWLEDETVKHDEKIKISFIESTLNDIEYDL